MKFAYAQAEQEISQALVMVALFLAELVIDMIFPDDTEVERSDERELFLQPIDQTFHGIG